MLEVEQTINKLDRVFQKVDKFNNREFTDPDNHKRREERMQERAKERWSNDYTFFLGGLTEEEQRYRDYYETDLDIEPDNEAKEELIDIQDQMQLGDYALNKYDFQEMYTHSPEEDQSSFLQQKIFRMKYRQFSFPLEEHYRREQRMVNNSLKRFESEGRQLCEELWGKVQEGVDKTNALKAWNLY